MMQHEAYQIAISGWNVPRFSLPLGAIDGKKNTEMWNDQISASVSVAAGTHRLALVAVDKFGTHSTTAINISAQ